MSFFRCFTVNSTSTSRRTDARQVPLHHTPPTRAGQNKPSSRPPAGDDSKHKYEIFPLSSSDKEHWNHDSEVMSSHFLLWEPHKVMRRLSPVTGWNAFPGTCLTSSDRRVPSSRPAVTLRVSSDALKPLHSRSILRKRTDAIVSNQSGRREHEESVSTHIVGHCDCITLETVV